MIKITNFINYYDRNYEQYFEDTDMLEYKEDVFRYIIDVFNMRRSSFKPYDQTRKIKANKIKFYHFYKMLRTIHKPKPKH